MHGQLDLPSLEVQLPTTTELNGRVEAGSMTTYIRGKFMSRHACILIDMEQIDAKYVVLFVQLNSHIQTVTFFEKCKPYSNFEAVIRSFLKHGFLAFMIM